MKLTEVLPIEDWINMEKETSDRFGLNASFFDADGFRMTNDMKWAYSLCPVLKVCKRGQSFICAAAHQNNAGQAKQTRKSVIGECDAGQKSQSQSFSMTNSWAWQEVVGK